MEDRTTVQVSEKLRKELKMLAAKRDLSYQELLSDMISVFKELDKERTIISIPTKLTDKVKKQMKDKNFSSASEYVTFVLRLVLSEETPFSEKDNKKIKARLERLGYL
jgi:Arc/MetJ-type ribon-helix-helix transcriptional regulator